LQQSTIPNLIVFGCPGAGKGSLAAFLVDDFGFYQLSTGNAMRAWAQGDSPAQLELREGLAHGRYGSDELAVQIVEETIASLPATTPAVIFDGFPRTPRQLEVWLAAGNTGRAVFLEVSEEVAITRIQERGTCPNDGTGYPGIGLPCQRCGALTVQRSDDGAIETIKKRFATYRQTVEPVIAAWQAAGLPFTRFDGDISLDELRIVAAVIARDFEE
jgi:adenylate kinase